MKSKFANRFPSHLSHKTLLSVALLLCAQAANSQLVVEQDAEPGGRAGWGVVESHKEHLEEHNAHWLQELTRNVALLQSQGKLDVAKAVGTTRFSWPVRFAPGRPEFGAWTVNNYIDHNKTLGQLSDHMCGTRTYDNSVAGHQGTDIGSSGVPSVKQSQEALHVIAAAPGTIVVKTDGNKDVNCLGTSTESRAGVNVTANEVTIQHADGMRSRYLHLKNDALTAKKVGDTVEEGEFLGIMASSGPSSGPHLHFEVRGTTNEVIDPWAGTCNATSSGLWKQQEAYKVPSIMEILPTGTAPVRNAAGTRYESIAGACVNNEIVNQSDSAYTTAKWFYKPGDPIAVLAFMRDVSRNEIASFELTDPQGAVKLTGNFTPTSEFSNQAFAFWTRTLPANSVPGQYALALKFAGQTKTVPIYVGVNQPEPAWVYDFYAASINHFFRVSNPGEAAAVASGAAGDWKTTGDDLWMLSKGAAAAGAVDVCRFYGHPTIGPNSHFYTADAGECAALKTMQAQTPAGQPRWNYEEVAFSAYLPSNGLCPAVAPVPVYRLYNNGFARNDSNHRLTSKWSVVEALKAKGWSIEAGGNPVMCATGRPY
jgi:murein DD-endopeptidase MepM/ murein hydrolase activator NlpD